MAKKVKEKEVNENIRLEVGGLKFWVIVSNNLTLFSGRTEAIIVLKEILHKDNNATIAEIEYTIDKDTAGTFNISSIGWKDIALCWAEEKEDIKEENNEEV